MRRRPGRTSGSSRAQHLHELGAYTHYNRHRKEQLAERRPVENVNRGRCDELLSHVGQLCAEADEPAKRRQLIRLRSDPVIAENGRITEAATREENTPLLLSRAGSWSGSEGT